jgi:hypothetical protein
MRKKTKIIKKGKRKGGESFIEYLGVDLNDKGKFIADNINYNVKKGNSTDLINKYELRKEDAIYKYNKELEKTKHDDENYYKQKELNFKYNKDTRDLFFNITDRIGIIINVIIYNIATLGLYFFIFLDKIKEYLPKLFNVADGVVLKTIVLLIIILTLVGVGLSLSGIGNNKLNNVKNNNVNDSKNIYFEPNNFDLSKTLSNSLKAFLPNDFLVRFNSLRNNLNNTFGNDIIDKSINTTNREEIQTGRYDNLVHVNVINDTNKVYTLVKPKDIELNLNINDYKSADYFKLPINIQNIISSNNIYIPSNVNNTSGLFDYRMENAYIKKREGNTEQIININTLQDYKPIFIDANLPNKFIFNSIDAKKFKIDKTDVRQMINFDTNTSTYKYPI